ncbi:hypothetical protein MNBD_ALPHA05-2329 [hydrothermal vent metagenome]|uniref:PEP-CTERM protein-sorting domain-containing protein n=1 Tax=hydrothermal vent metagenome TaxID=652676 RepID=A0A3B0SQD4_9ZZZZ
MSVLTEKQLRYIFDSVRRLLTPKSNKGVSVKKHFILAIAANLLFSMSASATLLTLSATSQFPAVQSDFVINFDDVNNDGLLEFNEILSFSGVTQFLAPRTFDEVIGVANVAGFTTPSGPQQSIFGNWVFRIMSDNTVLEFSPSPEWTYAVAPTMSEVPLPAALPLFLAGLAGLGWARRRRA